MQFDLQVKLAVYQHFAQTGGRPTVADVAERVGSETKSVLDSYQRLRARRMLVLEDDGASIRMAPPFSGVPTQHIVESGGTNYYANCAWDALGVPAALQKPATVRSRCAASGEPLTLEVTIDGPPDSDWLFHCLVPAAKWWENIVFT